MIYLNVSLIGLNGRLHPAITGVTTSHQVKKMRPHIKMLCGNYLTYEIKSSQSGGSPYCRLCLDESNESTESTKSIESLEHLISVCEKLKVVRTQIQSTILSICNDNGIKIDINKLTNKQFAQFLLDPSSMNLPKRIPIDHPALPLLFQQSRDFCYAIDCLRRKVIKE